MDILRKLTVLLFVVMGGLVATGCNTMEGFGQDVEKTGENIEESADRHKD